MKSLQSEEKLSAGLFRWTGTIGLVLTVAVFILYSTGFIPSSVPPSESKNGWEESAKMYTSEKNLEYGTLWFFRAKDGFQLSLLSLGLLGSTALPTIIALFFVYLRQKHWPFVLMCVILAAALSAAIFRS